MEKEVITNQEKQKRPIIISIIVIIGYIQIALLIFILSDVAKHTDSWYPEIIEFIALLCLVPMYGLWKMKKWGVYSYIGLIGISQIVYLLLGGWDISKIIVPLIIIIISLVYIKKMN